MPAIQRRYRDNALITTRALKKSANRKIGRAMHTYNMLCDHDRVLVAVSGGVDSLVLAWLLDQWRHKSPIDYEILAVHLDMGFDDDSRRLVAEQLNRLQVPFLIKKINSDEKAFEVEDNKSACYQCARRRRNQLFSLAAEKKFSKIAFGHHREDIIETFFLNIFYSGNISTMVPRQNLFDDRLAIIRPLAFLDKEEIREIAVTLDITPVANPCPMGDRSKRAEIRNLLHDLYMKHPGIKPNIFNALTNIRAEYLLRPLADD